MPSGRPCAPVAAVTRSRSGSSNSPSTTTAASTHDSSGSGSLLWASQGAHTLARPQPSPSQLSSAGEEDQDPGAAHKQAASTTHVVPTSPPQQDHSTAHRSSQPPQGLGRQGARQQGGRGTQSQAGLGGGNSRPNSRPNSVRPSQGSSSTGTHTDAHTAKAPKWLAGVLRWSQSVEALSKLVEGHMHHMDHTHFSAAATRCVYVHVCVCVVRVCVYVCTCMCVRGGMIGCSALAPCICVWLRPVHTVS